MRLTVVVQREGKDIATFDATGRIVTSTLTEPDTAQDILLAIRRAHAAAEDAWAKPKKDEGDQASMEFY
jgi:hypothetical protein